MTARGPRPRIVLVGPPGSGKSTVARALAQRWQLTPRDTDDDIERATGRAVGDLFVEDGEERFRELEREAVRLALAEHDGVLALGGGAVLHPETQAALAAYRAAGGVVVFLDVTLQYAAPRVGFNRARPLLLGNPRARWQSLLAERRPIYESVATLVVSTDGVTAATVAERIEAALAGQRTGDGVPEQPGTERPESTERPEPTERTEPTELTKTADEDEAGR